VNRTSSQPSGRPTKVLNAFFFIKLKSREEFLKLLCTVMYRPCPQVATCAVPQRTALLRFTLQLCCCYKRDVRPGQLQHNSDTFWAVTSGTLPVIPRGLPLIIIIIIITINSVTGHHFTLQWRCSRSASCATKTSVAVEALLQDQPSTASTKHQQKLCRATGQQPQHIYF
jgi:hypothetical protein